MVQIFRTVEEKLIRVSNNLKTKKTTISINKYKGFVERFQIIGKKHLNAEENF